MLRLLKRLALGLLALVALALLGAYVAKPLMTARLLGLPFGGSQGPTDPVRGGPVPALVVAAEAERRIPTAVLDQPVEAAAKTEA